MCRVRASFREKVFSSRHIGHRTFCLRLLWMVSSWRVKSYGREKMVLHGLLVDGLMRVHLCGPAWELRASSAADVMPLLDGPGDSVERGDTEPVPEGEVLSLADCCDR